MSVEVDVIKLGAQMPSGWRMMTLAEGKKYKQSLQKFIEEWSIIGFETGKLDGPGYGGNFSDTRGPECGEVAIIKDAPKVVAQSQPLVKKASLLKQATLQKQPTLKAAQEEPEAQGYEPETVKKKYNNFQYKQSANVQEKKSKPVKAKAKKFKKKNQGNQYAATIGSYSGPLKGKKLTYQYEEIFKIYNKQSVPGVGAYNIKQESNWNKGIGFLRAQRFVGEGFLA